MFVLWSTLLELESCCQDHFDRCETVVRMRKASTAMSSTIRCLKVLELLAEEPFELSFSDIAAKLKELVSQVGSAGQVRGVPGQR